MKIGFVVNDVATEKAHYTTNRLALAASQRGHEVWLTGAGDFAYEPDGTLSVLARGPGDKGYRSLERFLDDVQKPETERHVSVNDFDVVMLRNDPADDATERPWAPTAAVAFGQLIASTGVLVVNDPHTLANALSKAYFQHFPEAVRPRTLITRDQDMISGFIDEMGGRAVLKPLQGSGGSGVFLVDRKESPNLSQIVEAIARDGYVVAQEYLPQAKDGDVRLFLMNGRPLVVDGQVAAFRRRAKAGEARSNMSAGGTAERVQVTDEMLGLVEAVHPKLAADGMFLVGLDIVGDKLMEINVFSPGGLGSCQQLYGVDFAPAVIADLERKLEVRGHYGGALENARLATT
ncbi:glutathione synthase [Citricoccus sp. SGAir0253]|uniref:glutathione synthetase n=1 Tax=Citricoccus sp. SGAir0253 TaxID=2567881 RepID=UPI0010CCE3CD|nr:glutathione synthetase [Citricoccus sp. SGAir0253]QCU78296.1 glutathione synthase [Citricoccus sp. SGAir0253]